MKLTRDEYEQTVAKFAKLNERAARRGWTGRLELTGHEFTASGTNAAGFSVTRTFWDVTISGAPPSYDGWTFEAELTWDREAGLIVRNAPGVPPIDRAALREGECDHCRTSRYRKYVFLVKNDATGEHKQVGSTCIKDFLGWDTRPVWISTADASFDDGFGMGGAFYGGTGSPVYSTETVLAAAWACMQTYGYHKSNADEYGEGYPTKYAVENVLEPHSPAARKVAEGAAPYFAKSYEQAKIIRNWLTSDGFSGDSDYVTNLKAIATAGNCDPRNFGYLVSGPMSWARAMERELRQKAADEGNAEVINEFSPHEIKSRVEIRVQVRSIRYAHTQFGTSTVYTLLGEDKHLYKWFASKPVLGETTDGTWYTIKATISGHDEWQGARTTKINRAKILP